MLSSPSSIRVVVRAAALAAALATSACTGSAPRSSPMAPTRFRTSQWIIEPADVVRLRNWGAPDQSGDLLVNDKGIVLVPAVGRILVAGLVPDSLERRIIGAFAGRIDPSRVEVTMLRPIAVVGGVRNGGVQLADPSTSVLSLVARAGGPLRTGGDVRVFVLRPGETTREVSTADLVADLGLRSTDQLYVQDPSFLVRNEPALRSALGGLQLVAGALTVMYLVRR
jgi:protein involved in polysaccharide export with SLBB domain